LQADVSFSTVQPASSVRSSILDYQVSALLQPLTHYVHCCHQLLCLGPCPSAIKFKILAQMLPVLVEVPVCCTQLLQTCPGCSCSHPSLSWLTLNFLSGGQMGKQSTGHHIE